MSVTYKDTSKNYSLRLSYREYLEAASPKTREICLAIMGLEPYYAFSDVPENNNRKILSAIWDHLNGRGELKTLIYVLCTEEIGLSKVVESYGETINPKDFDINSERVKRLNKKIVKKKMQTPGESDWKAYKNNTMFLNQNIDEFRGKEMAMVIGMKQYDIDRMKRPIPYTIEDYIDVRERGENRPMYTKIKELFGKKGYEDVDFFLRESDNRNISSDAEKEKSGTMYVQFPIEKEKEKKVAEQSITFEKFRQLKDIDVEKIVLCYFPEISIETIKEWEDSEEYKKNFWKYVEGNNYIEKLIDCLIVSNRGYILGSMPAKGVEVYIEEAIAQYGTSRVKFIEFINRMNDDDAKIIAKMIGLEFHEINQWAQGCYSIKLAKYLKDSKCIDRIFEMLIDLRRIDLFC